MFYKKKKRCFIAPVLKCCVLEVTIFNIKQISGFCIRTTFLKLWRTSDLICSVTFVFAGAFFVIVWKVELCSILKKKNNTLQSSCLPPIDVCHTALKKIILTLNDLWSSITVVQYSKNYTAYSGQTLLSM